MMRSLLTVLLQVAVVVCAVARVQVQQTSTLESPDGRYVFTFTQRGSQMLYDLSFNNKVIVEKGELGVDVDNALLESAMGIPRDLFPNWSESLVLKTQETSRHSDRWTPLYGENAKIQDRYNQLTLHFQTAFVEGELVGSYDKRRDYRFDIEVRAYNEGLALRYVFPENDNGLFLHIVGDRTSMRFPTGTRAFYEEWAQGPYHLAPLKEWPRRSERPLLLHQANGIYTALVEAGLVDFVRGKIELKAENELQWRLYSSADVILPFRMPWRVIMCGEAATDLVNHKDLILNLNEPCTMDDTSFIRPGKAIRATRLNRADIYSVIDFASQHHIDYVEIDHGWYGPETAMASDATKVSADMDFDIPQIVEYARQRGIGIWLYVNQRAMYKDQIAVLRQMKAWGVVGLKIGFVQVGNQMWTTWLHDIIRACARYKLMVDIHDEYRPTGVSRTYPHLLTQEGIRGNEEMPDADHNVTLPFTRFLAGAADYTPCYFTSRKKTTYAHQLALPVVYYSPLQFLYWYDSPSDYHGEDELRFWDEVPTVWDESIAIDGSPGTYIVQARRKGDDWYVGVLNTNAARNVIITTGDFLQRGAYTMELYTDDPTLATRTCVRKETLVVRAGHEFTIHLQPSGGAAMRFTPKP